ncbi:hypothetical protein [Corynebacterium auriscanis]|uniref:Uncharacterized protein n=1 Tax=Corynebacterium auriscanis TaxID=99807 RepID=A0A0A2DJW7_9CORY|nr:hypothetical protein [Corynebacterium auriscanis]KGM18062.1 hypothetical protein MA47_10360 [Corynebacterium auriscanis]
MKDPTRIPQLIAELQSVWEALPDVPFAQLVHQLQAAGMSITSTDDDVRELFQRQLCAHPSALDQSALANRAFIVQTESPSRRIILSRSSVAVVPVAGSSAYISRSLNRAEKLTPIKEARASTHPVNKHDEHVLHPTVWQFCSIRTCRVSSPLVLLDANGISHHLGVVTSIAVAGFPAEHADIATSSVETLCGALQGAMPVTPQLLDNQEWLIRCTDGSLVLLGRWLVVFSFRRRTLSSSAHPWTRAEFSSGEAAAVPDQGLDAGFSVDLANGQSMQFGQVDWVIRVR